MVISIIALILMILAIVIIFKIDVMVVINEFKHLVQQNKKTVSKLSLKKLLNKKQNKIIVYFTRVKTMLSYTKQENRFIFVILISLALLITGTIICILIDNIVLIPVVAVGLSVIPFVYIKLMYNEYNLMIKSELETTLSVITMSYLSNNNIVSAVEENLQYIGEPLKALFDEMIYTYKNVNPSLPSCIMSMSYKINNEIFRRWCSVLIQCLDNHLLKESLVEIINRLTDERIIAGELKNALSDPLGQFYAIGIINVLLIPLLFLLSRDWFNIIFFTQIGKTMFAIDMGILIFCFIRTIIIANVTDFDKTNGGAK